MDLLSGGNTSGPGHVLHSDASRAVGCTMKPALIRSLALLPMFAVPAVAADLPVKAPVQAVPGGFYVWVDGTYNNVRLSTYSLGFHLVAAVLGRSAQAAELAVPPRKGFNWIIWMGPVVLVAAGTLTLLLVGRYWTRPAPAPVPAPLDTDAEERYRAQLARELDADR